MNKPYIAPKDRKTLKNVKIGGVYYTVPKNKVFKNNMD